MSEDLAARLAAGDPTLFTGSTAAKALGWTDHRQRYLGTWLDETASRLPRRFSRAIVLGMGGSSSPARFFAESSGHPLEVLDTSNPDTVAATDFTQATVIASSKSGTTIETQTLLARALADGLDPRDLVIVTDPGTSLEELGRHLGATVVLGDPLTGGRFSALSPFGLVPALYAGWRPETLRAALLDERTEVEHATEALEIATGLVPEGTVSSFASLRGDPVVSGGSLWLEQLLAETTGKDGRGVVPVAGEDGHYAVDEILTWHFAAALCARRLGVDPFNQPDVEAAKRGVMARLSGPERPSWPDPLSEPVRVPHARYVTIQAFAPLDQASGVVRLRDAVASRGAVVTANLGPRYLHSTGQLHKGGPSDVVALVVVVRPRSTPRRIEGRAYSFHDLHLAQALADHQAVLDAGRLSHLIAVEDLSEAIDLLDVAS